VAKDSGAWGAADPGLRPTPGVYVYVGSGLERVSVLGGAEHVFGPELAAMVELGDGCEWSIELMHAKEHRSKSTYCTNEEGVQLRSSIDETKFFGITETTNTTCTDAWLLRTGDDAATTRTWTCRGDGRTTMHELSVLGVTTARVGDETVDDAVRLQDVGEISGVSTGTATATATHAPDGMLLTFDEDIDVRSESPLGDTDYKLTGTWKLRSLTPH
jgi:hypothetical protein